jgi:hypothetical protein
MLKVGIAGTIIQSHLFISIDIEYGFSLLVLRSDPFYSIDSWLMGCYRVIREATNIQFFVTVVPEAETFLSGVCILSQYGLWQRVVVSHQQSTNAKGGFEP